MHRRLTAFWWETLNRMTSQASLSTGPCRHSPVAPRLLANKQLMTPSWVPYCSQDNFVPAVSVSTEHAHHTALCSAGVRIANKETKRGEGNVLEQDGIVLDLATPLGDLA
jgi:hypothetical protein